MHTTDRKLRLSYYPILLHPLREPLQNQKTKTVIQMHELGIHRCLIGLALIPALDGQELDRRGMVKPSDCNETICTREYDETHDALHDSNAETK